MKLDRWFALFAAWFLSAPRRPRWKIVGAALLIPAVALAAAGLLVRTASSQEQFADPAFKASWLRADGPVAMRSTLRGWVWGAGPGTSLSEPFQGLPNGKHLVQYFDKGRMEINNPAGNQKDPFYVTNGLLDVQLISGKLQTGVNSFETRQPASVNLASDMDDPSAPTYQSFNGVANIPGAPDNRQKQSQKGQLVRTAIDRQGVTAPWPGDHGDYGVRIAYYEPVTGHNVPDVFWDYLNQQTTIVQNGELVKGPLFYPWFAVTGYPISEAYWSYVKVSGTYTDVLIQAYERRVLTYVPHLPEPFKVQMGNIGAHYYEWRYGGAGQPAPGPGPATPTARALPPKANVTIDSIAYRKTLADLNGQYVTLTNKGGKTVLFDGWWLDSPKWDHVDRFYFPKGITLASGGSLRVHAGPGSNTAADIYMGRTSVMWDQQPYDFAVLYDSYGREVNSFFPAAEVGPPPTPVKPTQTVPTPTLNPGATGIVPTLTAPPAGTSVPTAQPTSPRPVGSPSPTSGVVTDLTPTPSVTPTATPGS